MESLAKGFISRRGNHRQHEEEARRPGRITRGEPDASLCDAAPGFRAQYRWLRFAIANGSAADEYSAVSPAQEPKQPLFTAEVETILFTRSWVAYFAVVRMLAESETGGRFMLLEPKREGSSRLAFFASALYRDMPQPPFARQTSTSRSRLSMPPLVTRSPYGNADQSLSPAPARPRLP